MATIRHQKLILLVLSIAWAIMIFVLCTMPVNSLPRVKIPHIDKIVHFGFFFVEAILLSLLFNFQHKNYFLIIVLSTFMAFVYGGIIEYLQQNYFNRSADGLDLLADIAGGFFGAMTFPTFLKLFNLVFRTNK